jgi:hypothetical protein
VRAYLRRVARVAFGLNRTVAFEGDVSIKRDISAIVQGDKVMIWVQLSQFGALQMEVDPEGAWLIGKQITDAADEARANRA